VVAVTRIITWGTHARRFGERHGRARLAGWFARSLHLEAHGDVLCIGCESIGRGPLNALMSAADWTRMAGALSPAGAHTLALLHGDAIHLGCAAIHTGHAETWSPDAWPSDVVPDRLASALHRCMAMARDQAPADGLARLVLGLEDTNGTVLARMAAPRLQRLQTWLGEVEGPAEAAPPVGLLGLGPGLTPSGDDVLIGVLLALHAMGQLTRACALDRAIAASAPSATTALSGACLRAAGDGLGCEALHATLGALLVDDAHGMTRALRALGTIGHTSGWDALAGAVFALEASAARCCRRDGAGHPGLAIRRAHHGN
jgi:hypothetical protein